MSDYPLNPISVLQVEYRVDKLFLGSFYTADIPFPLVSLYLEDFIISECVTSKLYLQSFVSNQLAGDENIKITSFIRAILDLETQLKNENWASKSPREPYLANIFGAHLTCWSFILSCSDFYNITNSADNISNLNLHDALQTGCIPLSQLFHNEQKSIGGDKTCDQVMINLKAICKFSWNSSYLILIRK